MVKRLLLLLALVTPVYADQVASQSFKGINSNENPLIIGPEFAQDALNVDVTPGGKSIKKRSGYGLYKTLGSGKAVHGGYHFFDSTGNDIQVWGSSVSLYGIVADATATRLVSSATAAATWDCADTQGNAYCVNSSRDAYVKTAGATINWYTTPLGTMVEATPDRIAVAGVSGTASTIYVSGSNAFTTFTVGPLATDPFTEVIAAPGSKITHLRWGCGKLLWWKDQSMGYLTFEDQYTAQVKIVSDNIGTFDNTSAIDPGGSVWFRGQDGHIYEYDCSGLVKQSIEISPFVQAAGRRTSNYWTQTSQSDFESGSVVPTGSLSTTITPGSVVPSSITLIDTNSSDFSQASSVDAAIDTTSVSGAVTLRTYISDSFPNMGRWTQRCGTVSTSGGDADFTSSDHTFEQTSSSSPTGNFLVQFSFRDTNTAPGDNETLHVLVSTSTGGGLGDTGYFIWIRAAATYQVYLASTTSLNGFWNDGATLCSSPGIAGLPSVFISSFSFTYDTSAHTLKLTRDNTSGAMSLYLDGTIKTTASDTSLSRFQKIYVAANQAFGLGHWHLDDFYFVPYIGNFNSRALDTGFFTPTFGTLTFGTSGTGTFTHSARTSASSGSGYGTDTAITSGSRVTNSQLRYLIYSSSLTMTDVTSYPQLTDVTLIAESSGTIYSAVKNAPNLSAWSTFNPNYADNGGSHSFYVRASSWSFPVSYLTPSWTSTTAGTVLTISTGTFFQVRDDFVVPSGTNTPTLTDFTVNWFDGSASDQAYGLYFDNAIWFSVAYGVGVSSNTYIFKRDLINDGWTVYGFGAGGMLVQNNHLFFGDVADTGQVFQYGSGTSDNGNSISAYWKTKEFPGSDPFLENSYTQLDTYWARNANQTATVAYTVNASTSSTSYSVSLSSTTQSIIRSKKNLPTGTNGSTINLKFSDTSTTSQWELFLFRLMFTSYPWKPG